MIRETKEGFSYYMKQPFDIKEINQWDGKDDFILFLVNNFGKINKNDLEVELFHLLLNNHFKKNNYSDYRVSLRLGIPENKIKRLRYESSILYDNNEQELQNKLMIILRNTKIKYQDTKLQVAIPDKMLRNYLSDVLAKHNRFYDSSFNSNIITLSANDIFFLLSEFSGDDGKKYKEEISKNIDDKEFPKKFMKKLQDSLPKMAENIASNVISDIIIQNPFTYLLKLISKL